MPRPTPLSSAVLSFVLLAAACSSGSDSKAPTQPTGPAALVGTWQLRTVNESAVPAVAAAGVVGEASYLLTISKGNLTFKDDGTVSSSMQEILTVDPGGSNTITFSGDGDYTRDGDVITLITNTCTPECEPGLTSVININTAGTELNSNLVTTNPLNGREITLELIYTK
jgi:hypothetical protein